MASSIQVISSDMSDIFKETGFQLVSTSTNMDDVKQRLSGCFRLVFPDLPEDQILCASQAGIRAWDSVATITLVNVVEEEFNLQLDLDHLAELDSFHAIEQYLRQNAG